MASGQTKPLYLTKSYSYSGGSLSSHGSRTISQNNFGYAAPSGYWYMGIMGVNTGRNYFTIRAADPPSSNMMMVFNYGSAASHTAIMQVIFVLSGHRESSAR